MHTKKWKEKHTISQSDGHHQGDNRETLRKTIRKIREERIGKREEKQKGTRKKLK